MRAGLGHAAVRRSLAVAGQAFRVRRRKGRQGQVAGALNGRGGAKPTREQHRWASARTRPGSL